MSPTSTIRPTDLGHLLGRSSGHIRALVHRARHLQQLTTKLQNYIKPPLSHHCAVTNINNEVLILHADSPVWAARLRYRIPDIQKYMQDQCGLKTLHSIRIRVLLPECGSRNQNARRMKITPDTARLLRKVAASVPDPMLRSVLLRLSRH